MTLSELERRVMNNDDSLTTNDFVSAYNRVDSLYEKYSSYLQKRADNFNKRKNFDRMTSRRIVTTAIVGKEMALPVGDRT